MGTDLFDDAGVYRLRDDLALVLSVDFFPPLVDDPYHFGRVAAANSLSDIYAMGASPLLALSIVGFPDTQLPIDILGEIMRGGQERATAAGALIVGGHSVRDAEVKFGLSVVGTVHPERVVSNAGAQPGDVLVLTKPVGSGVLASAAKKGTISPAEFQPTIDVMAELNAGACAALVEVGAHAATDITGFGLVGHAHELAAGSRVTVELRASDVPLLPGTLDLARAGGLTRTHKTNREFVGDRFEATIADEALVGVLCDAQTSGGLLIAVPEDRADALLAACRKQQTPCAAVVGRVTAASEYTIRIT